MNRKRYFGPACLASLMLLCHIELTLASDDVRVLFYNVDNYFDCDNDSLTADEEYLPGGLRGWTPARFWKKTGQIARVLAMAGSAPPDATIANPDGDESARRYGFPSLVGLAEIENEGCLRRLIRSSPLKNAGYEWIHYESPDVRGVDVALLYNPYVFTLVSSKPVAVTFPEEPARKTRDVLYACFEVYGRQSLHVFVCHFPSRLGGEAETNVLRCRVAGVIKGMTDSLLSLSAETNVLIMGDFNDYPESQSLTQVLGAGPPGSVSGLRLYNLMYPLTGNPEIGTYKHEGTWNILDQLIVSGALLCKSDHARIFRPPFLLTNDDRWFGVKPFRTYNGMIYQGGYSDHLPVFADLHF
ncbi:MAG: endonuclease [Bacteroidota bacterium]|nr:endonuclease [Bacteroidota bacterium]